jgi:two-component sensor histidine kinase
LPDDGVPDATGPAAALFGSDARSRRVRALLVLAAGIALGIIGAAQHILLYGIKHEPMYPARILAAEVLEWVLWSAFVPVIFWLDARAGFRTPGWRRAAAAHAALLLGFLLLHNGIMTGVNFLVDPALRQGYISLYVARLISRLPTAAVVYGSILAIGYGLRLFSDMHRRRVRGARLEAQLATARLQNMKMQLQPHFLFNTLHVIAGLVREGDRATAVEAITHLSDLLRQGLRHDDRQEVTLEEELEFLDAYLVIQRIRFGDRLAVRIDAPLDTRDALVPHLLFQPLVENAIRHGIARRMSAGTVSVTVRRADAYLGLEVEDDGAGLRPNAFAAGGVGLRNTMARLRQLYGDRHTFEIGPGRADGTVVRIRIPLRWEVVD